MTREQFREYCKKHKTSERLIDFKGAFDKSKVPIKKLHPSPPHHSNAEVIA